MEQPAAICILEPDSEAILNAVKAGRLSPKAAAEHIHADRALMQAWIAYIETKPILDRVHDDAQLLERLKRGMKQTRVLEFDPLTAAPRVVAAVPPLGDDAFKPNEACLPEDDRAVSVRDVLRLFLSRVCDPHHISGADNLPR